MTDDEAQQAFEQQLPVMFDQGSMGGYWIGPLVLVDEVDFSALGLDPANPRWVLSDSYWAYAAQIRLATPHELLTADEDTP